MSSFDRVFLKVFPGEKEIISSLNVSKDDSSIISNDEENEDFPSKASHFDSFDEKNNNQSESISEKPSFLENENPQTLFFEDYAQKRLHPFFYEMDAADSSSNLKNFQDENDQNNDDSRNESTNQFCQGIRSREDELIQKIETDSVTLFSQDLSNHASDLNPDILKLNPQLQSDLLPEDDRSAVIIPIQDHFIDSKSQNFAFSDKEFQNNLEITLDNQDEIEFNRMSCQTNDYFLNDLPNNGNRFYPSAEKNQLLEQSISLKEMQIKHFPNICDEMFQKASVQLNALGNAVYEEILAGHKIIGFNSLSSKSGCSILLLGLAGEMLSRGLSVLLIDGNFENPSLASLLEIEVQSGWEQAVLNHESLDSDLIKIKITPNLEETVLQTNDSSKLSSFENAFLYLLPLSKRTVLKAIKASYHPDLNSMIDQISDQFDLIFWDSGCSDVSVQEKIAEMKRFQEDGYYLIQDIRMKSQENIQRLVQESSRNNIPCLGIIENFV